MGNIKWYIVATSTSSSISGEIILLIFFHTMEKHIMQEANIHRNFVKPWLSADVLSKERCPTHPEDVNI